MPANIPAKLAAAQAAAKTKDDKYVIAQLQLKAAVDQKDNAGISAGIEAMDRVGRGDARTNASAPHQSRQAIFTTPSNMTAPQPTFERVLALDPN